MATDEVAINIHDHGIIVDERRRRIKCNYCGKVVTGVTRLKCHLGGIRGDVLPCETVPTNVKDLMRNNFLKHKRGNLSKEVGKLYHPNLPLKRNWSSHSNVIEDRNSDMIQSARSGGKKHPKVTSVSKNSATKVASISKKRMFLQRAVNTMEDSSLTQAQKCIGRFFYETGLDFTAANSLSFEKMMNAAFGCSQTRFRIPSCQDLKGWILENEVKQMQEYVKVIRNSWANTGCSILLDGWIDGMGRNLINILAVCPQGPIYLRSLDISTAFGNINALQQLLDEVIEEVGVDDIVQIITYSTSACMEAVGKQLMEKYRTIFWTVSASYCLELMLEKVGKMDFIKEIVEKAKTITKFIYNHSTVLKLMRNHTSVPELVSPSKIRAAMPFLTLENIVSEQKNLELMFVSSEWNTSIWASSREGKAVADLLADRSFWTGATGVLKATIPLVRVLHLIHEEDKPQLGYIYETIDQAKETIKDEFKGKKSNYLPVWTAIDDIWNNHLHNPLHSAGYFLNPNLFYSSDFFPDAEVASGLLCCIVRMTEGKDMQDTVSLQVDMYRDGKGSFGLGSALRRRSSISPAQWWSRYGSECPELQKLAIRILSQTCDGATKYHFKRSVAEKLLTKGRNRIEQQRLNDLTFLHYNLHLRNFELRSSSDIPFDEIDLMNDWVVDETEGVDLQNFEPDWMELNRRHETTTGRVNVEEEPSSSHPKIQRALQLRIEEHARYLQKMSGEQQKAGSSLVSLQSMLWPKSPRGISELQPPSSPPTADDGSPSQPAESKTDSLPPLSSKRKATDNNDSEQQVFQKRLRLEAKLESVSNEALIENSVQ